MANWNDEDILYKPEILTIVEYIAAQNYYRAKPYATSDKSNNFIYLQQIGGVSPFTDIKANNLDKGDIVISQELTEPPQNTAIYPPQTAVMALVPRTIANNAVDRLMGFIIGKISTPYFYRNNTKTNLIEKPLEINDIDTDSLFRPINDLNQSIQERDHMSVKNNLSTDVLTGDDILRSKHAYRLMDDYVYTVGTDLTKTVHCSITGEITDICMLKQERTIHSEHTSYVVGKDILSIKGYASDVQTAGFASISGDIEQLSSKRMPDYTYVEVFGDMVDGQYRTRNKLSTQDNITEKIPVWQEHINVSGAYTLRSSEGVKIGLEGPYSYTTISCKGSHFKQSVDDITYTPGETNPLKSIFPEPEQAWADPVSATQLSSYLDIQKDGSLMIKDSWGSYIKLSKGNIQIHAANNIFFTAARDVLSFSGGVESHRSARGVQIDVSEGDILLNASQGMIKSNANFCSIYADKMALVGMHGLNIGGNAISIQNLETDTSNITIGSTYGDVLIQGTKVCCFSQASTTLANTTAGLTIDTSGNCVINANVQLAGNLRLSTCTTKININNKTYTLSNNAGSIFVTQGGVYVKSMIGSLTGLISPFVISKTTATNSGEVGKNIFNSTAIQKMLSSTRTLSNMTSNIENKVAKDTYILDNMQFKFNLESQACSYIVEDFELGTEPWISTGTQGYPYPGKAFWEQSGLVTITTSDKGEELQFTGFNKYKYGKTNASKA